MANSVAQSAPSGTGDLGGWIERFGFPIVCAVVLAYVLYKLGRLIIEYLIEQNNAWQKRWEDEHDLRVAAEKRSDVSMEQGRTTNALLQALKDQTKQGDRA